MDEKRLKEIEAALDQSDVDGDWIFARRQRVALTPDDVRDLIAAVRARGDPVAWMTHHDEPMLFPTRQEAADYCEDDEPPIPLYTAPPTVADAYERAANIGKKFRDAVDDIDCDCREDVETVAVSRRLTAAIDEYDAAIRKLAETGPSAAAGPIELQGVSEAIAEGDGFWKPCSGCHESNDGAPTGPYSHTMRCHLGVGCHECGGIGAVWETGPSAERPALTDEICRICKGSGTTLGVAGSGPDTYDVDIDCANCNGTGEVKSAAQPALTDEEIIRLANQYLGNDARNRITVTRWKDGIDIDEPHESFRQFCRAIREGK